MDMHDALQEVLRCPTTGNALGLANGSLETADGAHSYPLIEGVPWLLPSPRNSLLDWGAKLHHLQQVIQSEVAQLERESKRSSGPTRQRLSTLQHAKQVFLTEVIALMRPVVTTKVATSALYDALRDRAPSIQNLLSYEANLYRDWIWGDQENAQGCQIVRDAIGATAPQRMVVLGAGSGRLAHDLHDAYRPELTVATDINPLLLMAANRVFDGRGFRLHEFPAQPRCTEDQAIEHTFTGLDHWPTGLSLAFADATNPPFASNAFDVAVTPWLIDIQPHELTLFLRQLNSYLPVGGRWINFGSLVFNQSRDAHRYAIEEISGIAEAAGFAMGEPTETEMPYLKSPYNAGYRVERVWSWSATKERDIARKMEVQVLPSWLLDIDQPIPRTRYFQAFEQQHRSYAALTADIDGKTSIRKLGGRMARQNRGDPHEATEMVRQFLLEIYQQNRPA
ncbi:MAG: hypothetical protein AAF610_09760 [Pseudomonadota bacterium]